MGCEPMPLKRRGGFALIVFCVLQVLCTGPCLGKVKRHDTIVMKNGDRLTGEVKRLEQRVLYIETDYLSGSVGLDWLQVEKWKARRTSRLF